MEFIIDGEKMRFRGTITVVSADNLSAQLIGGYKALNAAFRKCRNCMATNDTMQEKVRTECMFDDHGGYGTIGNCQTVASSNWQLKSPAYTKRQQPFGLILREK